MGIIRLQQHQHFRLHVGSFRKQDRGIGVWRRKSHEGVGRSAQLQTECPSSQERALRVKKLTTKKPSINTLVKSDWC
ncbi:hypothetical protein ATANTOWER_020251 [Ataeniobius toweri]|uniref:Uncharacterized protein n=1 Tax=Ataeniobius toweri TaxID=208326 RepID=A0ABU7AYT6_9TELE|nr:hypothetical protein [Ataeniobius toweri]